MCFGFGLESFHFCLMLVTTPFPHHLLFLPPSFLPGISAQPEFNAWAKPRCMALGETHGAASSLFASCSHDQSHILRYRKPDVASGMRRKAIAEISREIYKTNRIFVSLFSRLKRVNTRRFSAVSLNIFHAAARHTAHGNFCSRNTEGEPHVYSLCKPQHLSSWRHAVTGATEHEATLNCDAEAAADVAHHPNPVRLHIVTCNATQSVDD